MFVKYDWVIFYALLLLLLWPVWANNYFLTLDGPCHLYNASVLIDFWRGANTTFFSKFYTLNQQPDPNWFSHIVLAFLMKFLSPVASEKLLITGYILSFMLFSRWLIININAGNRLLSFIPFLFVCNHVFQMGFYNFSFSLAWMILSWLFFQKYINRLRPAVFVPLATLSLFLTYLAHPIGYVLACGGLFLTLLMEVLESRLTITGLIGKFGHRFSITVIAIAPTLLLLVYFLARRSTYQTVADDISLSRLGNALIHLSAITNLDAAEIPFAKTVFFFMVGVTAVALIIKMASPKLSRYDAYLFLVGFLIAFYFISPRSIAGAGIVSERIQILPFVILPFWLASINFSKWLQSLVAIISIAVFVCLMAIRLPVHKNCSDAITEYVSTAKYIESQSTVLPLNYSLFGKTPEGKTIANGNWVFFHCADYIGTEKPLIMLGNYEAHMGYFPLKWRAAVDPFIHLCPNDEIEQVPPLVNLGKYESETRQNIDYVILLCLDSQYIAHPNTLTLLHQLDAGYKKIYTSQFGRAILYQRNQRSLH